MRSNVIKRHLHFIYNVRATLQSEFYNGFEYASAKAPRGALCVE